MLYVSTINLLHIYNFISFSEIVHLLFRSSEMDIRGWIFSLVDFICKIAVLPLLPASPAVSVPAAAALFPLAAVAVH